MGGVERGGPGRAGRLVSGIAVALGAVLFLGGFAWAALVYKPYTVPTDSMAPTIAVGARVLAQRIDGDDVRRGDVVVFHDKVWGDMNMIKRVVGVGGDTVACCDRQGRMTVNGTPVEEPYLHGGGPASSGFSATVPKGDLFLLGDHRADSVDSRSHLGKDQGAIPRDAVSARVDAVLWPAGDLGVLSRPAAFDALPGGTSSPGPVRALAVAVVAGAALILGGAAYGPLARLLTRRRTADGTSDGTSGGTGKAVAPHG
ncbi:signal peptidase I [Streptomyces huiliensis]|uniref:signal peptidase I n=1 Tax=Streptomyces huiliensis TaxID=2876027 RepID=UPI001CBFF394|nr:signal peptidase I [Streptomyces huiliensis]MBZ4321718.1 signal peptidase I [Streptomyces huiliensis]